MSLPSNLLLGISAKIQKSSKNFIVNSRPRQHIKKQKPRDITLPTKARLIKPMVFPLVMYGCESWTVKKAEHRRIDAFELWCWRSGLQGDPTSPSLRRSVLGVHWKD